ncbi:MAG: LEPR-XLL domain-containing protein, partial [Verrucomicrobiae bacterium]|nr:LEPR-XLL domain-containing protein [Verrucomicrobiae bacterium]
MSNSRFQLEALEPRILLAADAALAEPLAEALVGSSTDMVLEASLNEAVDTFKGFEAGGLFEGFDEPVEARSDSATEVSEDATAPLANLPALEEKQADADDAATLVSPEVEVLETVEAGVFEAALNEDEPVQTAGGNDNFTTTLVTTLHAANSPPVEGDSVQQATTTWSGNISENTTWSDTIHVTGNITVAEGVTLTIDPGTVIKLDQQRLITVNGTVLANGTNADPIYFTSTQDDTVGDDLTAGDGTPVPGHWYGLIFNDGSDASSLSNVELRYAGNASSPGNGTWRRTALQLNSSDLLLDSVAV